MLHNFQCESNHDLFGEDFRINPWPVSLLLTCHDSRRVHSKSWSRNRCTLVTMVRAVVLVPVLVLVAAVASLFDLVFIVVAVVSSRP